MTRAEKVVFISRIFKSTHTINKWIKVVDLLGHCPDSKVARKIDVSVARVCQVRREMGITPVTFNAQCEFYGTEVPERPNVVEF